MFEFGGHWIAIVAADEPDRDDRVPSPQQLVMRVVRDSASHVRALAVGRFLAVAVIEPERLAHIRQVVRSDRAIAQLPDLSSGAGLA
ncbi:hypothetical protein ACQEVF_52705 [Nonomuraea polychroma]|uniref:hypothetical protein n=1 Tax=Nonomuraea polychroma TaxID=46176 RepID=UPI003D8F6BF9